MTLLTASFAPDEARARYALGVLADLLGLQLRDRPAGEEVDVAYGDGSGRIRIPAVGRSAWDDERPAVTRRDSIAILHPRESPPREGVPSFDLLYATYASLTAPWEARDPADEVGCPLARSGFLDRHGLLLEPLVHRYAALLGELLGHTLQGEPRIVLTHDVDDNFAHLFARRASVELLRRDLRDRRLSAVRRAAGLGRRLVASRAEDANDRFDDWRDWHAGWSSRPAYFVASAGLFSPGSARRDVAYDVRHPSVRETLRRAVASGAEIGVHFSIHALQSADRLRAEREALEEAAGTAVRSARHHWWALGRPPEPTWKKQAAAGIELDCSLGFNDSPGFRRGICVPFRPFDPERNEPLATYALPTVAMDASLPDAVAEALKTLGRIVRDVRGALVLDWHVHSANEAALPGAAAGLRAYLDQAGGVELRTPLELLDERRSGS